MDVRMPDGTLVRNVPDNVTQEDLLARYDAFKSDKRGNIINTDVPTVVGTYCEIHPLLRTKTHHDG